MLVRNMNTKQYNEFQKDINKYVNQILKFCTEEQFVMMDDQSMFDIIQLIKEKDFKSIPIRMEFIRKQ